MRILLWHHQFLQIWWANQKHFKSLLEIRTSTSERQISSFTDCLKIKHCLSQQSPQSNHKRPLPPQQKQLSIKSLQPYSRLPNHWINNSDQLQPLRLRKKTLFPDQPFTSASKKPRTDQTTTTKSEQPCSP